MGAIITLIQLAIIVLTIAGMWQTFVKAGKPGWACIIPIYNIFILISIAGRPVWWLLLFFIPIVNIIFAIIVSVDVAAKFGKSAGFGVGLALLPFIFFPLLAFTDAQFSG